MDIAIAIILIKILRSLLKAAYGSSVATKGAEFTFPGFKSARLVQFSL
jgi:hypothetical protein